MELSGKEYKSKQRNYSIDFMKSILVIVMILAHVVQFFRCGIIGSIISNYANLTTFSGFVFVFGFVSYISYIENGGADITLGKKLIIKMIKTIGMFYISGIAYTVLVSHQFSFSSIIDIIIFKVIPNYSEFLLSFAFLYPLVFLFALAKQKVKQVHLILIFTLSLFLTLIDYDTIKIPILGVFVGTNTFACFPIVQYISYFLAGIYMATHHKVIDKYIIIISIMGFCYFAFFCLNNHNLPSRFPPTACWIVGGYIFVYLYYIISNKISKYFIRLKFLFEIGQNTLVFLVISNIVIFSMSNFKNYYCEFLGLFKWLFCIGVFCLCFLFSFLWLTLKRLIATKKLKKINH